MGAGDDRFTWDPGDGSDTIEGQDGRDAMTFNGANVAEAFDVSANGGRVRSCATSRTSRWTSTTSRRSTSTRSCGDTVTVNDVSGTDVTGRQRRPGRRHRRSIGDGAADQVIVNATNGDDAIRARGQRRQRHRERPGRDRGRDPRGAATDSLAINALAGDDVVEASGLAADAIRFSADGGEAPTCSSAAAVRTRSWRRRRRRSHRRPGRRRARRRARRQRRHPGLTAQPGGAPAAGAPLLSAP
jgi:Ca2+-binding RTX toxin-like protein